MKTSIALTLVAIAMLVASVVSWPTLGAPPEAATVPPVSVLADAEYGRQLFAAKGCTACHRHAEVNAGGYLWDGAPDLTDYEPNPTFTREWLRNPRTVRPGTIMPDFNLTEPEIEAFIAFLDK